MTEIAKLLESKGYENQGNDDCMSCGDFAEIFVPDNDDIGECAKCTLAGLERLHGAK